MSYAGREWKYQYRHLFELCDETKLKACSEGVSAQFAGLTRQWSIESNSEWTCRMYFATKMILNATVLLNSLEFSRRVGMRIANPYFEYYAALSLMRGLACTLPSVPWQGGNLIEIGHGKAINLSFDWMAKFNRDLSQTLKGLAKRLKAQRELVSYRAPASGDTNLSNDYDLEYLLVLLAEAAQFNSELLEASVTKYADPSVFEVTDDDISAISEVSLEGFTFPDPEDRHRLSYVKRKIKRPYHLALFMTEGQTEDFVAAWNGNEDEGEQFSNGGPSNWQSIFDIP